MSLDTSLKVAVKLTTFNVSVINNVLHALGHEVIEFSFQTVHGSFKLSKVIADITYV